MQHQRGAQPNPPSQESKDPKKVKQLRLVCGMISNQSKLVVSFKQMFFCFECVQEKLSIGMKKKDVTSFILTLMLPARSAQPCCQLTLVSDTGCVLE